MHRLIQGLAERGHEVHVVAADLEQEERRGPNEFWWPGGNHPFRTDALIAVQDLKHVDGYVADSTILMTTTNDPWLGPDGTWGRHLAAVPCMSQAHQDLLLKRTPSIPAEKCVITGLGVDQPETVGRGRPYRLFCGNDPARGLWHLLAIFDLVREQLPEATLHVAYDFDRQFENYRWLQTATAERLWQCKERIEQGNGIFNMGALSQEEKLREQFECAVHVWPSDPPGVGSQTHGLTQMELAAAGVPLVLSDIESFPELFSECAVLLPLPGTLGALNAAGEPQRVRYEDWATEVVSLLTDEDRYEKASTAGIAVAAEHTWDKALDRWDSMLAGLAS